MRWDVGSADQVCVAARLCVVAYTCRPVERQPRGVAALFTERPGHSPSSSPQAAYLHPTPSSPAELAGSPRRISRPIPHPPWHYQVCRRPQVPAQGDMAPSSSRRSSHMMPVHAATTRCPPLACGASHRCPPVHGQPARPRTVSTVRTGVRVRAHGMHTHERYSVCQKRKSLEERPGWASPYQCGGEGRGTARRPRHTRPRDHPTGAGRWWRTWGGGPKRFGRGFDRRGEGEEALQRIMAPPPSAGPGLSVVARGAPGIYLVAMSSISSPVLLPATHAPVGCSTAET